jgi:hypothetical protein
MERKFTTYFGLLVFTSLAVMSSLTANPGGTASAENLYVRVSSNQCGMTQLTLSLENVDPLPGKAILRIKAIKGDPSDGDVVVEQPVELRDGKYWWDGLLPFAEYKAQLLSPRDKNIKLGDYNFTNEIIARKFIEDKKKVLIQVRSSEGPTGDTSQYDPGRNSHEINDIMVPPGVERIHIILINSKGELADQYLGKPLTAWRSKLLPVGTYTQIIIGYGKNECGPLLMRKRS